MEIKKGIGVSPGVVVSTAIVLDAEDLLIPKRQVDVAQAPAELARFREAIHLEIKAMAGVRVEAIADQQHDRILTQHTSRPFAVELRQ